MTNNLNNPKNWWAPVWRGLVVDQEGKHYQGMKNALWLFLYLVIHADRTTGKVIRKCQTISQDMGISPKTIGGWLSILKFQGYVTAKSTGHSLELWITKWKNIKDSASYGTQNTQTEELRLPQNEESERRFFGQDSSELSQEVAVAPEPNDISIKKDKLNDDIDRMQNSHSFKESEGESKEEQLALYLAQSLNDLEGLALYLSYSRRCPESFLRKVLAVAEKIPEEKIRKSRGALFNHLIQKHGKKFLQHPGS